MGCCAGTITVSAPAVGCRLTDAGAEKEKGIKGCDANALFATPAGDGFEMRCARQSRDIWP